MSAVPFSDPLNVKDLIDGFPRNPRAVLEYVNQVLPGWVCGTTSQFAVDLAKYNVQWAEGCVQLRTVPQEVVLVRDTYLGSHQTTYKLVKEAIQRLSETGFIVIDTQNFDFCSKCRNVIVARHRLEDRGLSWSGMCQGCFRYDPRKPLPN